MRLKHSHRLKALLPALTAGLVGMLSVEPAYGDGAFPDSQGVLLPPDLPNTIIVGTNFGLVRSDDDGAHWQYLCETVVTNGGRAYILGAPPQDNIYAIAEGAVVSSTLGCSWTAGAGFAVGDVGFDLFPDPSDALHALTVTYTPVGSVRQFNLYESRDGGITYAALPSFLSASPLTGVEIAKSDPLTWYVTQYDLDATTNAPVPKLLRTSDGGVTWQTTALASMLGNKAVYLAAVSKTDAQVLFLRVLGTDDQGDTTDDIVLSRDGGASFVQVVGVVNSTLTALLQRDSGVILVAGAGTPVLSTGSVAQTLGFRSLDGGSTFQAWDPGVHVRGLGERGGTLFATADDSLPQEFALGSSDDEGATWKPLLHYANIDGIYGCVAALCTADCQAQVARNLFPESTCGGSAADGGPGADGSGETGRPASGGGAHGGTSGGGCSCDIPDGPSGAGIVLALVVLGLLARRARRAGGC